MDDGQSWSFKKKSKKKLIFKQNYPRRDVEDKHKKNLE